MTTGSLLEAWRQANPVQDFCENCGAFGHCQVTTRPDLGEGRLCYVCVQTYPESVNPQLKILLKLFSMLLNELKPPKKPKAPRQPKAKMNVTPMTPRRR